MTALNGWLDPVNESLLRSLFTEGTGPGRTPRFLTLTASEAGAQSDAQPDSPSLSSSTGQAASASQVASEHPPLDVDLRT